MTLSGGTITPSFPQIIPNKRVASLMARKLFFPLDLRVNISIHKTCGPMRRSSPFRCRLQSHYALSEGNYRQVNGKSLAFRLTGLGSIERRRHLTGQFEDTKVRVAANPICSRLDGANRSMSIDLDRIATEYYFGDLQHGRLS